MTEEIITTVTDENGAKKILVLKEKINNGTAN